jgi:transglutaminase-like putative cysteine protease
MKKILLLLTLSISPVVLCAQDFAFGQYSLDEINMPKYGKDTSAHAVVLKEFGKTWLSSGDNIPLVHEYHAKIKIFDNQAFGQGTIEIPIYKLDNNRYEEVTQIEAVTYYKDDNGLVQKAELDPKNIFHEKKNKYWDIVKFTLPNLHKGCVIEYKYHLETPSHFNFKTWVFQSDIPKIYSEYEAHIPAIYIYNVSLRGPYKLTKNPAVLEPECFSPGNGIKCDCSKISYIMADIPAFIPEDYMTAQKNFMSAIYFELSEYTDLSNGAKIKVTKEWKDIDYEMKHYDSFGGQIKRSSLMKDRIQTVIAGKTDELSKANAIYSFIQKTYKWNGFFGIYSEDGIKKALDNHSGSIADINLSLVAALNAAGISTEAVLLSTREHGLINKLYPIVTDFNYVVAKANIGDKSYLLDATDPLLPFGLLPLQCINDQGRVMNMDKPSYWIDMVATEKKSRTFALDLTLQDNGKIKGTLMNYSYGYAALDKRKAIKKFNSIDEYVEDLDNRLKKMKILKWEVPNLDSVDRPLSEKYEIEFDALTNTNNNGITFSPFFIDRITENPFKLQERNYPVDRGAMYDDKYILTLHLPKEYTVETMPQNVALAMPLEGGRFLVNYGRIEDGLTVSSMTQFNRSVYSPDEYPYLKEMFNKIIQAGSAEIVLKKN